MSKRAWKAYALCGFGLVLGSACGSDDEGSGGGDSGACSALCKGAGFETGSEMKFEENVTECVCSTGAGPITQDSCTSYCDGFGVPAEKSFLSTQSVANDKCVCDGTGLPANGGNNNGSTGDNGGGSGNTGDSNTGSGSTGNGSSGGSTGGSSNGTAGVMLDAQGYPQVPDDALGAGDKGTMHLSVTESTLQRLGNGTLIAPYSPNASSANTVSFLDPGFIFTKEPVMQLQINLAPKKMSGSWKCDDVTDMLVRYGNPPSGANALTVTSCSIDYVYEASSNSYSGKLTAELGDAYSQDPVPVPTQTAKLKGGFAFPAKE